MFKILSEAAKGIPTMKQLEAAGKLTKNRPYSSSGKKRTDEGLTDFSKRKDCTQKACMDRALRKPEVEVPPCEKAASPKTWRTCPEPPKPKEFSCDDTLKQKVPQRKKRAVASRPACSHPSPSVEALECVKVKKDLCPRIGTPCCVKFKFPPKCPPKKVVRDCIRLKPPVASFSECYKNPFPPQPRSECTCLTTPKICM
ncbi:uncharacterized protein LOC131683874 [Topomyia yanbarensis]|uniref:uncharacterized protein LOC131683874 n=1 Tax=Topomyia yanbarensis TaxID=2498891 RepID=UPI00273B33B6|nr:uncharacterized protein LOC131683874 [Topomyia yanbarensis]